MVVERVVSLPALSCSMPIWCTTEAELPTTGIVDGEVAWTDELGGKWWKRIASAWVQQTYQPQAPAAMFIKTSTGPTDLTVGAVADGQYLKRSGTTLVGDTPSGGGGPSSVKSTADQTKTDGTLINVTNCSFSLTSGVYYKFQFLITFRSSVATVGLKIGLTFPGITRFSCTAQIPIAAAGAGGTLQGYITASGGAVTGTAVAAINTDYLAVVDGLILPSANGTLQLQFAAETTGATVTCRQGTCGVLYTLT